VRVRVIVTFASHSARNLAASSMRTLGDMKVQSGRRGKKNSVGREVDGCGATSPAVRGSSSGGGGGGDASSDGVFSNLEPKYNRNPCRTGCLIPPTHPPALQAPSNSLTPSIYKAQVNKGIAIQKHPELQLLIDTTQAPSLAPFSSL
jgi:hypothetical protein